MFHLVDDLVFFAPILKVFFITLFCSLTLFLSHLDSQSLKVQGNWCYDNRKKKKKKKKKFCKEKKIKNAFYSTSKALFVHKIFKFSSWLFGHVAKGLDKKDKVNFKFYVTAWLTNNVNKHAQYLPNISRSKGNQTMKFGQLM